MAASSLWRQCADLAATRKRKRSFVRLCRAGEADASHTYTRGRLVTVSSSSSG